MKEQQQSAVGNRILKASGAVFVAHFFFKLVGFVQFYVVGVEVDTPTWETVYGFAFEGVIFSLFLIGEEMIGPAFLPLFIAEKEEKAEKDAWHLANTLLSCQIIILGIIVMILMLFPETITRLVTYWDRKNEPEYFSLAIQGVRLMAPALIFFSIGSTTYMLLNGYKKFFMAAFGDAVWKVCVLLGVVVGIGVLGFTWKALVFGIIAGSVAKVLTHLAGMPKMLKFLRPSFYLSNPAFRTLLILMLPLFAGIIFAKVRDFYNNITVLSSLETSGLIKANAYGRKIFSAIGMIVPYTLSIAMFPFFCDLVTQKDQKKLGDILTQSGRMLLVFFIPVSMVFIVFSHPLVKLLVAGKFSWVDAELSGISMACYTLVLPAYSLEMLLMQAFFANRKTYSVTVIGIIFSTLSIVISYVGIIYLGASGVTALMVVALGFVFSRTGKVIALTVLIKRTVPLFHFKETAVFLIRVFAIGFVTTVAVWLVFYGFDQHIGTPANKIRLMIKLAAGGAAASVAYVVTVLIFKIREPFEMLEWGLKKVRRKANK